MLKELGVKNFAVFKDTCLYFDAGFHVITGESGVGKSLFIKALRFVLGQKVSSDLVRSGCKDAQVWAVFAFEDQPAVLQQLRAASLIDEESAAKQEFTIRRRLRAGGGSRHYVNDMPVSVRVLQQLTQPLVTLIEQNASVHLARRAVQVPFFTRQLEPDLWQRYLNDYKSMRLAAKAVFDGLVEEQSQRERLEFLRYQLDEIEAAKCSEDEYNQLLEDAQNYRSQREELQQLDKMHAVLEGQGTGGGSPGRGSEGLSSGLSAWLECAKTTQSPLPSLGEARAGVESCLALLGDLTVEAQARRSLIEQQLPDIEDIEQRISTYQGLFHRFGVQDIAGLMRRYEQIRLEWQSLSERMQAIPDQIAHWKKLESALERTAELLAKDQRKQAELLSQSVSASLQNLGLKGASFHVLLEEAHADDPWESLEGPVAAAKAARASQRGMTQVAVVERSHLIEHLEPVLREQVQQALGKARLFGPTGPFVPEFRYSSGPGHALTSLGEGASGGELARIALALYAQVSRNPKERPKQSRKDGSAKTNEVGHLWLFDEIDTGVSGRIADAIGRELARLAQYGQVLAISHLAQVAAHAEHHICLKRVAGQTSGEGKPRASSAAGVNEKTQVEHQAENQTENQAENQVETKGIRLSKEESLEEMARILSGAAVSKKSLSNARQLREEAQGLTP